ncbi:MAG: 50S ribosomal protein L25 [Actinobacteria bacterium]|nr:MAG: 50S ribosomal protein L25 [Actinomycetota bacterium]
MAEVRLTAEARTDFGKGAARRLRRDGKVPAVLYGDGEPPRHVSLDGHDLNQALKQPKVILEIDFQSDVVPTAPRDVQRDAVKGFLKHIDLVALDRAALKARQIEAEAVARAEEVAAEKELDPIALSEIVSEMLHEGADADGVVDAAVERLEAEMKAQAEAAAAAAAAEDAAAAEAAEGEGGADAAESGGESSEE